MVRVKLFVASVIVISTKCFRPPRKQGAHPGQAEDSEEESGGVRKEFFQPSTCSPHPDLPSPNLTSFLKKDGGTKDDE